MNVNNKTVLITGGASGIGLEAARQFLALGNKVIITGRNKTKLDAAQKAFPKLTVIQSDVADLEDAISLFNKVRELGGIDILYNNAGVGVPSGNLGIASDTLLEDVTYEMEINYLGVVRLNNLFMEMLKSRKEAAIINTTSILSIVPSVLEATYSASKTALAFYTQTLRAHLNAIDSKVKVFELLPPLVATEMTAGRNDKKISTQQLVNRLIAGLKKDQYTIRVGDSKTIYFINRLFPRLAFALVNSKREYNTLKK
jgi:uncharacterized oxidoreductase